MGTKEELESQACTEKRERLFRKLQTTFDLIKKLPENDTVFLARAERIVDDYKLFEEIQDKLARLNLVIGAELKVSIDSVSSSYEEMYYCIIAQAQAITKQKESTNLKVKENTQPIHEVKALRPKLPPVNIPKFKGDIESFPAFKSLFDTLVHKSDLAPIQKFSFLKSYVEQPALSVIENFDFIDENYQSAYDKLVERYTDKRLVGNHFLNKLLHFKPLANGSAKCLQQFIDVFCVQFESLKALNIPDLTDFVVFNLAMRVLDHDTKRLFEDKHAKKDFPTFSDLVLFVKEQHKVASIVQAPHVGKHSFTPSYSNVNVYSKSGKGGNHNVYTKSLMSNNVNSSEEKDHRFVNLTPYKCPLCKSDHKLYLCTKFSAMDPATRFEKAKSLKLCYSCLGSHVRSSCTSKFSCRKCKSKNHHTMLHREQVGESELNEAPTLVLNKDIDSTPETSTKVLSCHLQPQSAKSDTGLLSTVKCHVRSSTGEWIVCRMVVDTASESSFITEAMAQLLRLPRQRCTVDVVGVGSSTFSSNKGCVTCKVAPIHNKELILSVEAIVLPIISSNLPKIPLHDSIRKRFKNVQLADPEFDKPGPIDMLLGVQHYSEILSDFPTLLKGEPAALDTIFGFVIFGKIPSVSHPKASMSMFTHVSLDKMLCRFWEAEEAPSPVTYGYDLECERFYSETTKRDSLGRYHVSLPFKDGIIPTDLGSTRDTAHNRLLSLERRLARNPELEKQYHANLQDYVINDHMRPASSKSDYLLTHHAVIKESTSTQVRVVFNASEKSDTSLSLNALLLTGTKLQTDISEILLSFRMNPIALTADIKQMFRCIRLNPADTKFTHLLWRSKSTSPIVEWELTTLPFGLTCSPFLAQRTIKQLVIDEGLQYPEASHVLQSNTYIDDVVCSVATKEDAISLYEQLTTLLGKGGFKLHKLSSNSNEVLNHIPLCQQENPVSFESSSCIKLLGFHWNPSSDMFTYKLSMETPVCTKRGVLSQVARIYDINGYLTPVTFWIKYFIQRLWLAGIGWDEDLPSHLKSSWLEFYSQLPDITEIRIPRYISCDSPTDIVLVGFCDASEKGYAACVYLRVQSLEVGTKVHLLRAKSKVAPLKTVTIPRLELNGAVLLSKLISSMKDFLSSIPSFRTLCFTDSTTVLSWLHTSPHLLKTYVSNRVVQILEVLPYSSWRHVSGKMNPADMASRGLWPNQLNNNCLWWCGPTFLSSSEEHWPAEDVNLSGPLLEQKNDSVLTHTTKTDMPLTETLLLSHSSLIRVQRVLSYVLRFISNAKARTTKMFGVLTHRELSNALKVIVRSTQIQHLPGLIKSLNCNEPVKGPIRRLTPFICSEGLVRVGGRLASAPISSDSKHPFLIPRKCRLAELLCDHYHKITLHGGPQLMQSLIQRRFWIPGIRYLLRSVLFKCLKCYRFKAKPVQPLMANVPSCRFANVRAFISTGVDLAGPFLIKEGKRRNAQKHKCWVVLFICLTTRAVHIDIVSDLTSDAFLSALDRFISRRGVPSHIFSDLGTNFVGAERQLKEIYNVLKSDSDIIRHYCEQREMVWDFNPPSAPNFGGSWEAAIKSMKHHLRRVVADTPLTYEELSTLLTKIEAVLNSRPLCPISSCPDDGFDYLTPGHFLVGGPVLLGRPEESVLETPINRCTRWQMIYRSVQDMWRRWSQEYIHTLMQRQKWDKQTPNLTPGLLVLLMEKNLPPTDWLIGRVVEIFPGADGVVRVVKIKTPRGLYTRPVNKLCLLPHPGEDTQPQCKN